MPGDDKYIFAETLNLQERWLGLPKDEFAIVASSVGIGLYCNMIFLMLIVAAVLWYLMRILKKGQGSYWMLNFCYWYLPTFIFRISFKSIPDSSYRHWRA